MMGMVAKSGHNSAEYLSESSLIVALTTRNLKRRLGQVLLESKVDKRFASHCRRRLCFSSYSIFKYQRSLVDGAVIARTCSKKVQAPRPESRVLQEMPRGVHQGSSLRGLLGRRRTPLRSAHGLR